MIKRVYKFIIAMISIVLLGGAMMSCEMLEKTIDYEACSNYTLNEANKGKITLNGETIITNDAEVFYDEEDSLDYAMLPVVELLQCLGCELEWENDHLLQISLEGREYTFDISEQKIIDSNGKTSYINDLGGGKTYVYVRPKKIILNHYAITGLLLEIEKPCYFDIDIDTKTVDIIIE